MALNYSLGAMRGRIDFKCCPASLKPILGGVYKFRTLGAIMIYRKRVRDVAKKLHTYFNANAPGLRYLPWDSMTEEQRSWWFNCAIAALRKSDTEKKEAA
jgi:hypothetical protein